MGPRSTPASLRRLRFSLLASLGLLPIACGGSFHSGGGGDAGDGGSNPQAGSSSQGGSSSRAGSSSGGSGNVAGTHNVAGTSSGGTGVGGGKTGPSCTAPKTDPNTGLVSCDEGYTHRPQATACEGGELGQAGASNAPAPAGLPRADGSVPCLEDPSVCSAYQYGYCNNRGAIALPSCLSGCITDPDCGAGFICVCGHDESPTGGACRPSTCTTDADCNYGYCASYAQICGDGGFACHAKDDECLTSADCAGAGTCTVEANGHRVCENAVCGRPFLVDAEPRLPPVIRGGSWLDSAAPAPRVDHLTADERRELAAHWTRMGQMEHASIAAFARFSLQLLAFGAPPELVEACTRALADETAHTKLCFELASAYAGRPLAPGPLDVSGSLSASSLDDVVELVIAEGCLGEANAALDAREAQSSATDPVVRRAYARIAEDEERHAQLAFQFVRWALAQGGARVRRRVEAAIDALQSAPSEAARHVTLPCLRALVAEHLAHGDDSARAVA